MFSLEYAQLLTQGKDLQAEVVAGTEEGAEAGEEADEKWNHGPGFIAHGSIPAPALNCLNLLPHGVMATHNLFRVGSNHLKAIHYRLLQRTRFFRLANGDLCLDRYAQHNGNSVPVRGKSECLGKDK